MSSQTKAINEFFRLALKEDVESILDRLVLTERQRWIFDLKYVHGHDINYIADMIGTSSYSVDKELKRIRSKIAKALGI